MFSFLKLFKRGTKVKYRRLKEETYDKLEASQESFMLLNNDSFVWSSSYADTGLVVRIEKKPISILIVQ